jgi:hypothetical protein
MNDLKLGPSIFAVLSLLMSSLTSLAADVTGRVVKLKAGTALP